MGLSDDSELLADAVRVESSDGNAQLPHERAEEETKHDDDQQLQLQLQLLLLESDAALAAAMSGGYEAEDPVFLSCQICFDVLLEHETVTRLCGDACTLEVCAECLVQHLTASVYSYYPGVLPKVRCPTCFTLLNKSVWVKFVKPELVGEAVAAQPAPAATEVPPAATEATADVEAGEDESAGADVNESALEAAESVATDSVAAEPVVATAAVGDGGDDEAVAGSLGDEQRSALETDAATEESVATETEHTVIDADASNDVEAGDAEQQQVAEEETPSAPPQEPASPAAAAATTIAAAPSTAQKFDFSHVLEKYEILCRQSCEFQSPCCHNPEYTMLPPFSDDAESKLAEAVQTQKGGETDPLPALKEHLELFCFHREDTKAFYDFFFELLSASAAESALWHVLAMIRDEERRATLLLYHLFLHPDTYTLCCDEVVCFKCKTQVHHAGQCDDFLEDDCVLQCRGCHVTLVKVDGCDSVSCVCGHSIHWPSEMAKQRSQRKQLAPEDDAEHALWLKWKQQMSRSHAKIASLAQSVREVRLSRLIRRNRPALLKMLGRFRSRKAEKAKRMQQQLELEQQAQEAQVRTAEEQASVASAPEEAAESTVAETTTGERMEANSESLAELADAPPSQQEPKRLEGELQDDVPTPLPAAA